MCEAATEYVEEYIGRQLINCEYELSLQGFGCGAHGPLSDFWYMPTPTGIRGEPVIQLPVLPAKTLNSIKYLDQGNTLQTLDAAVYQFDPLRGRVAPAYGAMWPPVMPCTFNPVKIKYVAGYGVDYASIPIKIRQALSMLVAYWFGTREANGVVNYTSIPDGFIDCLSEFKRQRF
jgi:uncharacterized phiE125 gp8 family phage protein